MRLLALDVGERRIGLASGVSELGTALPAGYLRRTKLADDIRAVVDAAATAPDRRHSRGYALPA